MRRALLPAAILLLVLCACSRRKPGQLSLKLREAVRAAKDIPPCASIIPVEWPATWPVPTGGKLGREFKVLFYPMALREGGREIDAPLGEALLDADAAAGAASCRRLPGEAERLSEQRWPAALSGVGMDEFESRADRLDSWTEDVAALYAAKKPLSVEQAAKVKAYGRAFREMAEPALLEYYYRMNPDFWDWLKAAGAATVPKP